MSDTQWPRFQVFLQERDEDPFQDVGSVHAPDPELALLNARDVFVRRPECRALWVVPVEVIFSKTAEELAQEPIRAPAQQSEPERYHLFCKQKPAGTHIYAGETTAGSPEEALLEGLKRYSGNRPPFVWWTFPDQAVLASDPADAPSFFDPALDKKFRISTDFHTVSAMRRVRSRQKRPAGAAPEDRDQGSQTTARREPDNRSTRREP